MSPTSYQAAPPRIKTSSTATSPSASHSGPFLLLGSIFEAVHYRYGPSPGQPYNLGKTGRSRPESDQLRVYSVTGLQTGPAIPSNGQSFLLVLPCNSSQFDSVLPLYVCLCKGIADTQVQIAILEEVIVQVSVNAVWYGWCRRRDLNPHEHSSLPPQDSVSTNSTTSANIY
jgi:hypothetical protein